MTSNVDSILQLGLSSAKSKRLDKKQSRQLLTTINEIDVLPVQSIQKQKKSKSSDSQLSADMSTMVTPATASSLIQEEEADIEMPTASPLAQKKVAKRHRNREPAEESGSDNDNAEEEEFNADTDNSAYNSSDVPSSSKSGSTGKRQRLRANPSGYSTTPTFRKTSEADSTKKRSALKQIRTVIVKTPEMLCGLEEHDINNFFEMIQELQRDEVDYDRRVLMQQYETIITSLFQALKQVSNKHRFDWMNYDDDELRTNLLEMVTQRKVQDFDQIATLWLTNLKASLDSSNFGTMLPLVNFQFLVQEKMYECGYYSKLSPAKFHFDNDDQEEKFTKLLISTINRTSAGLQKPALQLMSNDVRNNFKPKNFTSFFHAITSLYAKEMQIFRASANRNIISSSQGGNPNLSGIDEEDLPQPSTHNQSNNAKCFGCGRPGHLLHCCPYEKHKYFNQQAKNNLAWIDSKFGKHFSKITWPNSRRPITCLPADLERPARPVYSEKER